MFYRQMIRNKASAICVVILLATFAIRAFYLYIPALREIRAKEKWTQAFRTVGNVRWSVWKFWEKNRRYPETLLELVEQEPSVSDVVRQVAAAKLGQPLKGFFYTYTRSPDATHFLFKAVPLNPVGEFQALSTSSETVHIINEHTGIPVGLTQEQWQAELAQSSTPLAVLKPQAAIPKVQLDQVADRIRSLTPATVSLISVDVKPQAILVKGIIHAEQGEKDMGQLERYIGILKELPGITSVDIESVQRSSEKVCPLQSLRYRSG